MEIDPNIDYDMENDVELMAELDAAIAEYEANPEKVYPIEEVFANLRERLLSEYMLKIAV
jgi:putative addiction module component (TIGR02574 family)